MNDLLELQRQQIAALQIELAKAKELLNEVMIVMEKFKENER